MTALERGELIALLVCRKSLLATRKEGITNAVNYKKHLEKQLFPAIKHIYPRNNWIFLQDGASSHTSNLVLDFLQETIPRRFIRKDEWPTNSPDTNPFDYYFWNQVKEKVYKNRMNYLFQSEQEFISKIKAVCPSCASNVKEIRKAMKQFTGRLEEVKEKNGSSIKLLFG